MPTMSVQKLHQLFDESRQLWFDTYEAPGIEGRPIRAEVPREVQQPKAVAAHLLSKGAQTASVWDAKAMEAAIATEAPVIRRAARMGWRDDNQTFISHRFVAPEAAEREYVLPDLPPDGAAGQLRICGTLKGWQELVTVARHSTAMTVVLCATFAAPLVSLLHRPSFALVLFGPSKIGKSFVQLAAASAMGYGREKELPTLNASPPGLLAAALAFNDHMLPINEIGTAQGKKSEIYEVLRDATYALLSGQDKLRHPSWSGASGASATFSVLPVLSSEHSPDAWAARNAETRDDGEMARLIGVPALASGCSTIFDRPPRKLSGDALATWEKAQFKRLHQELPNQRGIAFRDYLDILLKNPESHSDRAGKLVAMFEADVAKPSMSPVARDIVAKFGVLFAGGVLAAEAKVLPLDRRAVGPAMRQACLAALAELPDPQGELRADLAVLCGRLASGAITDLETCSRQEERSIRNADGYREVRKGGTGVEFVVRAQACAGWFATPMRMRRVLEWLDTEGFLEHGRDRTATRSNVWAQKQVTWPNETRVRSIAIYLPRGLADLTLDG